MLHVRVQAYMRTHTRKHTGVKHQRNKCARASDDIQKRQRGVYGRLKWANDVVRLATTKIKNLRRLDALRLRTVVVSGCRVAISYKLKDDTSFFFYVSYRTLKVANIQFCYGFNFVLFCNPKMLRPIQKQWLQGLQDFFFNFLTYFDIFSHFLTYFNIFYYNLFVHILTYFIIFDRF